MTSREKEARDQAEFDRKADDMAKGCLGDLPGCLVQATMLALLLVPLVQLIR